MLYDVLKTIAYLIHRWIFRVEVKGIECVPRDKPFILASNHISNLDPVTVGSVVPFQMKYLGKEELFKNKMFGNFLRAIGVVPLKRGKTDIGTMRTALKILKKSPLLVFPQGRRSVDYNSFKSGVGFLCKKSGVPVIAAKVYGTDKILPPGGKRIRIAKARVVFAEVKNIKDNDSYEDITRKVVEKIKSLR
jgi:1-acyl-sn-glycerol-3-phosphate acyltransferase